jgi:hypothetical protein
MAVERQRGHAVRAQERELAEELGGPMRERRAKHPKRGSALTQIPLEHTHQIWRLMRERQHQNAERVHGRAQKLECPAREHRSQRPQRGGASAQV